MAQIPKPLIPTIVIISFLSFFVLVIIGLSVRQMWLMRRRRIRRLTQSDRSRQSIKKLTIDKGRVVSTTESFPPLSPSPQIYPQRQSFWSIRRVPLSSSAERNSCDPPARFDEKTWGHRSSMARWARPNIGSMIGSRSPNHLDMAERGIMPPLGKKLPNKISSMELSSPEMSYNPAFTARDRSMDFRIKQDDYSNGLRLAPLTTQSKPTPIKPRRAGVPTGQRSRRTFAGGRSRTGGPALHVPALDRRQVYFSPQHGMDQVFDSLENAPPSRKSQYGLLKGSLIKKSRSGLAHIVPKRTFSQSRNRRHLSVPDQRPQTRGKLSYVPTRRIVSDQDYSRRFSKPESYVPAIRTNASHRTTVASSFASTNKTLPDLPAQLSARPRSLEVHQPLARRKPMSPRVVDRLNSVLLSIPGSPTESRFYATDEEEIESQSEVSRLRPLSYVSSRRSRQSLDLIPKLSLASLGPDLKGFRKSIAPSITSSTSQSASAKKSKSSKSPTRSAATHVDWLDTEASDDEHPVVEAPATEKPTYLSPPKKRNNKSSSHRPKSFQSLYDVSEKGSTSFLALSKSSHDGQHSRGLSNFSLKSFGTISSLDNAYGVAEAMPVLAHGPPTPKDVTSMPTMGSPEDVPPVPPLPQKRLSQPQPLTLKRLSQALPPSPPPPSPPLAASIAVKRKQLVRSSRRIVEAPKTAKKRSAVIPPPLDLRAAASAGPRSSRLLRGPVSPMSIRTAESLQRERSLNYTGYTSGTETSGSGKENGDTNGSIKSRSSRTKAADGRLA